jgi:fructose-1,6-bisphosphatase/inositol monophosphatase family enzyme
MCHSCATRGQLQPACHFQLVLNYGGMLDNVAGVHIATAAGARASTMSGSPIPVLPDRDARPDFLVAATPELQERILALWS